MLRAIMAAYVEYHRDYTEEESSREGDRIP